MKISRQDLYERIWSEPLKHVAPTFSISDVALSKICGKHNIPRPPRGHWDPKEFDFTVGEQKLSFTLDHHGIRRCGYRNTDELQRPASLPFELRIQTWESVEGLRLSWQDEPRRKLERQLAAIIPVMIVTGEALYRQSVISRREYLIERKTQLIENARQLEEEARRQQLEEQRQREQAKIDRLLDDANAFQQAETIRKYVADARLAYQKSGRSDAVLNAWTKHALATADRIDPVVNCSFLSLLASDSKDN